MKKTLCQRGDDGNCTQCGQPIRERLRRTCQPGVVIAHPRTVRQVPLLGDRIEAALTSIGITKERWGEFTKKHKIPGCGGCDKRQSDLNAIDEWFRNAATELGSAAVEAISKIWMPIRLKKKPAEQPPT
jgi:hypothetical protein